MRDRLLLTGADGYVGQRLKDRFAARVEVVGLSRSGRSDLTCDLTDAEALTRLATAVTPRWIVHAAGNKNIASCERSPGLAFEANVNTTLNLLRAWPGVPLLYISTDYVFCGALGNYTETSSTSPQTAYGRSKLCAELAGSLAAPDTFTSVRVSALYDRSATFLRYLGSELSAGQPVECFVDALYSPTYVEDFASALLALLDSPTRPRVVHLAGPRVSRYAFARMYASAYGYDPQLIREARLDTATTSLYPDLSLATQVAASALGFAPTEHAVALRQLARGGSLADSESVPQLPRLTRPHARRNQRRPVGGDQLRGDGSLVRAGRALSPRHA